MNAQHFRIVRARELARTIGVPESELYSFASERRLPFHNGKCGFGISQSELSSWITAARQAANEKENGR